MRILFKYCELNWMKIQRRMQDHEDNRIAFQYVLIKRGPLNVFAQDLWEKLNFLRTTSYIVKEQKTSLWPIQKMFMLCHIRSLHFPLTQLQLFSFKAKEKHSLLNWPAWINNREKIQFSSHSSSFVCSGHIPKFFFFRIYELIWSKLVRIVNRSFNSVHRDKYRLDQKANVSCYVITFNRV